MMILKLYVYVLENHTHQFKQPMHIFILNNVQSEQLGHIKLILSFSSSPAPDFSARVGQHEYQMGGVWGRVLASRDQIDTSLRSLYIAGTINR